MWLLGKPKTYLGIDFGTGGIKVVEFGLLKGKPRLLNYAYVEQPEDHTSWCARAANPP